jgi:hypothetical protein
MSRINCDAVFGTQMLPGNPFDDRLLQPV